LAQNTKTVGKYSKLPQNVQNGCKIDQMSINIQTSSIAIPSKNYPNFDFRFENNPSGNPESNCKNYSKLLHASLTLWPHQLLRTSLKCISVVANEKEKSLIWKDGEETLAFLLC
jgi:hypothetical protein